MTKYLVKAKIEIDGIVEKHDIIGALFGQTEGLLGNEFDLRTLQDKGRIGRIQVSTKIQGGKTIGEIGIPSNLDRVETALLAALIETVDKVGPYDAKLVVTEIIDLRLEKLRKIVERATEILREWGKEKTPDVKEVIRSIQDMLKVPEPISYGPDQLPAGPDVEKSDTIIVVEGRADVLTLLRYGYKNGIALGGARRVPDSLRKLAEQKNVILLVDGDHAGDLIVREVLRTLKVDYVARAPQGKEVEDLTGKELEEVLSKKVGVFDYIDRLVKQGLIDKKEAAQLLAFQRKQHGLPETVETAETITMPLSVVETVKSLHGTLEGVLYSPDWGVIKRLPVRDLYTELENVEEGKIYAVMFDGIITQRVLDEAAKKKIKILIGARWGKVQSKPQEVIALTFNELT